ncbi:hypothetical protein ASPZODRAFT_136720 [Penicilliopsis zonata CBS 506.65]|uniref:Thioredoxin domain-containing protein n=1 Tax=Penicilliopsis zonata CBS 506.65 TaxID=1073090 RepID=A0A1L9S7N5_9EURO|nr:hypothetical protein ASPZODRAFT_136720 [Penicilliopsis zonata CBS 506.65]OJJ43162.1 hypothetical protein ASPZODRAFT_136720 [Penicilliopsis zonata CBS 506.65]
MSSGQVTEIDNPVVFKALISSGVVVVDFFATWCGPCKAIAPQVQKFSETYPSIRFLKVDVDKVPEIAAEHGVSAMPTFLFFKDGEKVDMVRGANPPALQKAVAALA